MFSEDNAIVYWSGPGDVCQKYTAHTVRFEGIICVHGSWRR